MINLFVISSIFLLTKQVLLKKNVIVVGKLIRSRVLRSGSEICEAPRGGDGARKFFQSCGMGRAGDGVRQKPYGVGAKTPFFGPALPHCHLFTFSVMNIF